MANLLSIAELSYRQLFPNPTDETKLTREDFIATAKGEYALQLWLKAKADRREEGRYNVPSYLLTQTEFPVENKEIDLKDIKVLTSLDEDTWLQNVGGLDCECRYIKTNINMSQLMCGDDSMGGVRTYLVLGKKIKFPEGTHADKLPIIYANNGENIDGNMEVDDAVGQMVRTRLIEIYGGKTGAADQTNNTNPDI